MSLGTYIGSPEVCPLRAFLYHVRTSWTLVPYNRSKSRRVVKDTHGASDTIKDTAHISDNAKVSNTKSNSNGTSGSRVQNILEILRVGGSLGIRDIASNLPEYSEKMIQRELLGMVARGQIRKIGLKRWSKYSLAQ